MEPVPARQSRTTKTAHVLPPDTNHHGTMFGGKVSAYIDEVAAIAAARHSRRPVVTASMDSIDFLNPIRLGDAVTVEGVVSWCGRSSMEVFVKVTSENLATGERQLTTTSFLTMVALDEEGKSAPVPQVIPETEEEKFLHDAAPNRREARKNRKKRLAALQRANDYLPENHKL
ncbi:acyl-CoA thioesterase [Paludifilum halophilum]|uniref:Acyl-CoA thioesterase n=1 Tax=Paludifilum halophilum TaxID=1642702 RepID=A0A235BC99_9BACL|nr:acyl-CoA thioesterase [Paludifilum halophilum]OYD09916.1 acyl-CoA thioesterase [Paludifilum halophilum]